MTQPHFCPAWITVSHHVDSLVRSSHTIGKLLHSNIVRRWVGCLSDSLSHGTHTCVVQDVFLPKHQLGLKPSIDDILASAGKTILEGPLLAMLLAQNGTPVIFVRLLIDVLHQRIYLCLHLIITIPLNRVKECTTLGVLLFSTYGYYAKENAFHIFELVLLHGVCVSFLGREWLWF